MQALLQLAALPGGLTPTLQLCTQQAQARPQRPVGTWLVGKGYPYPIQESPSPSPLPPMLCTWPWSTQCYVGGSTKPLGLSSQKTELGLSPQAPLKH